MGTITKQGYFGTPPIVTNGLILHFDAGSRQSYVGSGTAWNDLSGNRYTGTLTNGPVFNSANQGIIVFDGVNDYAVTSGFTGSLNLTVCAWCKLNYAGSKSFGRIAEKGLNSEWGLVINKTTAPTKYNVQYFDSTNIVASNTNIDSNNYQFVTVVIQDNGTNSTGSIYVNGIFDKSGSRAVTVANRTGAVAIGAAPAATSTASTSGSIPVILYYNRALSDQEIAQNYNALKNRFGLT